MPARISDLTLSLDTLNRFAQSRLVNNREDRLLGGGFCASMEEEFSADEVRVVRGLYREVARLKETCAVFRGDGEVTPAMVDGLVAFAGATTLGFLADELEQAILDAESTYDTRLTAIFRELMAGPFPSLYGLLDLVRVQGSAEELARPLFYLSRDQLKIMRALVRDLDPAQRALDEEVREHAVDLILEKWRDGVYRAFGKAARVYFVNHYNGVVAERCLEFAEVDRIFYHLVNNAVMHGSEDAVCVHVLETSDGRNLCWVFVNPLESVREAEIRREMEGGRSLFEIEESERRFGLTRVAEAVASAYGLESPLQAVAGGHVGIDLDEGRFLTWFHWPRVAAD